MEDQGSNLRQCLSSSHKCIALAPTLIDPEKGDTGCFDVGSQIDFLSFVQKD